MSQAIRSGIVILAALLVLAVGLAGWALIQKKNAEDRNISLQDQLTESQKKQEKAIADAGKIKQQVDEISQKLKESNRQKDQSQASFEEAKRKADDLTAQIEQFNQERESWKSRIETIRKERDEAVTKLQNQPEKIVYKDRPVENISASVPSTPVAMPEGASDDEYLASVLKQKAELQVLLDKANTDLNNDALQVADLRKQNSELQLQVKQLNSDKEEIDRRLTNEKKEVVDNYTKERQDLLRKIKDGEDLASNLSMEAARARGDQKNANDFIGKVKTDNGQLQSQVRQLVATKVALEKTVARLTEERADLGKKLNETEGVIQDRINEIWQIKKTLDDKITQINDVKSGNRDVELPPIVVNASGKEALSSVMAPTGEALKEAHKVISVNEKNGFVIVDYGETQGSSVGRILKAFRNNKEIGTLEIIQVRRDISAADVKDQKTKIQVGDQVR